MARRQRAVPGMRTCSSGRETPMLRSRIGLGLVLACLVFSLTACGGGGDEPTTPPTPTTQTCLDGSAVSANQACPTPTEEAVHRAIGAAQPAALDRAASALPTFGSVSQSSNVQDGMTTDSVSIAYIPHGDTFHPIATIRTGDGTVLKSNADPTRVDVELPSGEIIHVDPASAWETGSGEYPAYYSEVYDLDGYLPHPRADRIIKGVYVSDALDDSIKGPRLYTYMNVYGLTDYPSAIAAGDDAYVSWGTWAYYTITSSALDLAFGAFADGVETSVSNIPITGTASYAGHTFGHALKGGTPTRDNLEDDTYWDSRYFIFLGQVNLQADFATASVRGQVNNFQQEWVDEGEHDFLKNLTIDLGAASIVFGTFTGDARATAGLAGAAGKWGGQFFGTPDAGAAPPAAGGTWGVTQGMGADDWKMLGGFGAWKP